MQTVSVAENKHLLFHLDQADKGWHYFMITSPDHWHSASCEMTRLILEQVTAAFSRPAQLIVSKFLPNLENVPCQVWRIALALNRLEVLCPRHRGV